ncbi:MAG: TlpA family protein disulfide reductase [Planctomycetaceae bacterium]
MSQRSFLLSAAIVAGGLVGAAGLAGGSAAFARQPATAEAPAGSLKVPPLPAGTPAELLAFVEGLRQPTVRPKSREEMMSYMKDVATVTVQAADKILAQVQPADATGVQAAKLKLESLMMLGRLGDEKAAADMATYAKTLATSPNAELAADAQRMMVVADAQQMFTTGDLQAGSKIVERTAALLAANPDDAETASLAMQLSGAFENLPGGEDLAAASLQAFGPLFAKSSNPQIKQMGESFAGTLRRLSLPGKPMEIKGTLLDGSPFNQASVAGKVVLVDFWATWCGPCVAEIPNMLEQYEKYHAKGFEIVGVSLDEDRDALVQFVNEKKLPWPVLFEKPGGEGWQHPLATFYGITGIPQLILIGRDGNVITLNARGEQLGEKLAELFKDAG